MSYNPTGLCQCGCGGIPPIAKYSEKKTGIKKGEFRRYIAGHCCWGVVRSYDLLSSYTIEDRGHATPCWIWSHHIGPGGYGLAWSTRRKKRGPAHRVMWEHFNGPFPEGLHADHLCRVRCCVNPAHIEPVTPIENARRGLNTRIQEPDRLIIRQLLRGGGNVDEIAAMYGLHRNSVYRIARQKPL